MIAVRKANERGHFDHGWLDTYHTFSFADYFDPMQMGFRALRVINDDRVAPGQGFGMHPHRDMEIVTVVLKGKLEHKDSLGHGAVLAPDEVQRISAGTGILHSEFNPSPTESVHLYQIWLQPDQRGVTPRYDQKRFDRAGREGKWQLVISPDGFDGSIAIHQSARVYRAALAAGQTLKYRIDPGRYVWLQVLAGAVASNGSNLVLGDGLAVSDVSQFSLIASEPTELLLFDLA